MALVVTLAGVAIAFLAFLCARDPKINFLPRDGRAEWILFPTAVDARSHDIANLDVVFRRVFTLDNQPRQARLNLRAAKRVELKINGTPVNVVASRNWKDISTADALTFLRTGTNIIEARVFNDDAPPLLWFFLDTDQLTLRSDPTWEASFTGSAWRRSALASAPRFPGAGNPVAGGERTLSALGTSWPVWLAFAGIALVIWTAGNWWVSRRQMSGATSGELSGPQMTGLLIIIASFWMILFWHNTVLMPFYTGFDSRSHFDYIKYVQERWTLPLPTEGFEMHQPPLYYVISAATLSLCGLPVTAAPAVLVLRLFTMLFGIAHFTLVFLSLRLLFPNRIAPPLIGLLLAAFLPMNLYMSHYCTNETLAALLVSASVYFCLRILSAESASWIRFAVLGVMVGAALLTKITALLAVPFILSALAYKLARQRAAPMEWASKLGVLIAIAVSTSAWHYARVSKYMGGALVGGPETGFSFWQDEGYRTLDYFARFGESLLRPLFSVTASFADGLYSTLWGDGLWSGVGTIDGRPPWNYDLMCAGYLLSILPTGLIFIGAAASAMQWLRKGGPDRLVVLGLAGATVCAVLYVNLTVPRYASVKSFYAMCALIPLCFFGAIGWDVLTRGRKLLQFALGPILLVWAMNSYASFWIQPSVSQRVFAARKLKLERKMDQAAAEAIQAVNSDPSDATARRILASVYDDVGRATEALEQAQWAVELSPMDSACRLQLGILLAKEGQRERAINETRLAIKLGPENLPAYNLLSSCLVQSGRPDEAITVARDGLTVSPFGPQLHYTLGVAFAQREELVAATNQFGYALLLGRDGREALSGLRLALVRIANAPDGLKHLQQAAQLSPESPKLLNEVAWLLATHPDETVRNGDDAVRLAEHACAITGRKIPTLVATVAAALAETGRFPDAIKTAQEALSLARLSRDGDAANLSQSLLASFRANRPYREYPSYK